MTLSQQVMLMNTFVIRLVDDGALSLAALQAAVAAVDASQVVTNVKTVDEYAGAQLIERRAYATMMSLFGAVSFLLALVGVYGVLAHLVSQRRREIGIRMALGAQPAAVVALVVRHGMWLVAVAMAVGTAASLMLTRVIHSLLWGITPTDPLTFAVVDAAFVLIGMIACLLPARRASRIDPLIVINDA
jgi:ABC-type antimicrobial peptide transport system permease subunit